MPKRAHDPSAPKTPVRRQKARRTPHADRLVRNDEGLTRSQAEFVENFTTNPTVNPDPGGDGVSKMLAVPQVLVAVAKRQAGLDVTVEEIVDNIVRISGKAEQAGMYMACLKAQELLGKYKGMWIEKSINVNIDLAKQHTDALIEKMKQRRANGEYVPRGAEILHLEPIGPIVVEDPFAGF